MTIAIRPMTAADWPQVEAIYAAGIAGGDATFETDTPSWEGFDRARLADHRFVAEDLGSVGAGVPGVGVIAGWVAVSPVSSRPAYAGVVEHSVYVAPAATGRGVGSTLLMALIDSTESAGIWTLHSGIFPTNKASLALHARHGFRVIGTRERVGQLRGTWRDVLLLERRSRVVG